MRPQFIKTAVAVLVCSPLVGQSAWAQGWNGSYAADGQCFCVGDLPTSVSSKIVPTPIGGQAISQVCQRIGTGPGLSRSSGIFNYPVYPDPQCGNGPFLSANAADPLCAGSLDGKKEQSESCEGIGPKWNLSAAFAKPYAPAAAKPTVPDSDGIVNKPLVSSSTITAAGGDSDSSEGQKLKTTVIRSASTANRDLAVDSKLDPFTGKKVTIDSQRYLQAREGLSANGGEPGSRIILDGLVFLRDDGSINPANLYRTPIESKSVEKASEPKVKPALPVVEKQTASKSSAEQRKADAEATTRQALKEKEKRLSAEKLLAEKNARQEAAELKSAKARLEEESRLKAEQRLQEIARLKAEAEQRKKAEALAKTEADASKTQEMAIADKNRQRVEEEKRAAAEQEKANAEIAAQQRINSEQQNAARIAAEKQAESVAQAAKQVRPNGSTEDAVDGAGQSAFMAALRLPAAVRASSRDFSYLEAMPVSYDVGGTGGTFEASYSSHSRFQYTGRIGVTANYNEVMLGAGYFLTPDKADRLTVVLLAGIEYGAFELTDDQTPGLSVDFDDSGLYLGAATRFVLNNKFELKAGVGFSSIFEGDAMLFGGGYYHINRQLDLVTRFEVGDNDLLGIGVRFYY